jgi:hypothetical protein
MGPADDDPIDDEELEPSLGSFYNTDNQDAS